jgi:hypothetical protein
VQNGENLATTRAGAGAQSPLAPPGRLPAGVGLWHKIRDAIIRSDEPGLTRDDEPPVSSIQYPKADPTPEEGGEESVDAQREGEGFR